MAKLNSAMAPSTIAEARTRAVGSNRGGLDGLPVDMLAGRPTLSRRRLASPDGRGGALN
jgi:hypothetical protein